VELGDNIIRQIPFNDLSSCEETASKFLEREKLPKIHLPTVIKHLKQNSKIVELPKGVPHTKHLFFD
jgi:hypothetical protein